MKSKKTYFSLTLIIVLTTIAWISSCTHDAKISDQPVVCFQRDILPIFTTNCGMTGCHDGGSHGGRAFDSYANISRDVVAGNPNKSNLYQVLINSWGFNRMPPNQPLSLENRTLIRVWIEQGAAETLCPDAAAVVDPNVNPDPGTLALNSRACFSRDILPVLVSRCATTLCHDAITHKGGYNFTDYTSTLSSVKPGSPSTSKLYSIIKSASGEDKMPPAGKPQLTAAEIDSIKNWIGYGALNETCTSACDTVNTVTFSGSIWPTIQSSCTGCHSGSAPSGNVTLASYANVASVSSSGMLVKALKGLGVAKMPPAGALTSCKIRQFELWANNGSLNN